MVTEANGMGPVAHRPRIGVLSVQGDFAAHTVALEALGVETVRVTAPIDLEGLDALVLPGGESTTMLRLIEAKGLRAPLEAFVTNRPVLGTCAGVILLGRGARGLPAATFGVLDVEVERNGFGRQIHSFTAEVSAPTLGDPFEGVFIRAPRIRSVGPGVEVVATLSSGDPAGEVVGVRSGQIVGISFHPELTADLRFHRWFVRDVVGVGAATRGRSAYAPTAEVA